MHSNKYIALEGLEGAGKTTACNIVLNTLQEFGIKNIIFVRDPGSTQLSEELRNVVLNIKLIEKESINDKAEMLIFYAARVQLVETVIKPALTKGLWVISDRYDLSTQAYQGGGRGIDRDILSTLYKKLLGDFRPHLTLYLDITPEISLKRMKAHGELDRIEQESLEFFTRTRVRYLELAEQDKTIYTIDATRPLKEVIYTVRKIIINQFLM